MQNHKIDENNKLACAIEYILPFVNSIMNSGFNFTAEQLSQSMTALFENCMIKLGYTNASDLDKHKLMGELFKTKYYLNCTLRVLSIFVCLKKDSVKAIFLQNLKTWGVELEDNHELLLKFYKNNQSPFTFLEDQKASISQCNFIAKDQENNIQVCDEIIEYQWSIYSNNYDFSSEKSTEPVDIVIIVGKDNDNEIHMKKHIFQFVEKCENKNMSICVIGDSIKSPSLNNLPKAKNVILWGHGSVNNNGHSITLFHPNSHNSCDLIKDIQKETSSKNIMFLACFGGAVIDDMKHNIQNSLLPNTHIFVPSSNDDTSGILANAKCAEMYIDLLSKENVPFPIFSFIQNVIESIPETSCYAFFSDNKNDPIQHITFRITDKVKDNLFTEFDRFNGFQIANLNSFIDNCLLMNKNHFFKNHINELVLDGSRFPEKDFDIICEKRKKSTNYNDRRDYYKNRELHFHTERAHNEILENYFQKNPNEILADSLFTYKLNAIFCYNIHFRIGDELITLIKHGAKVFHYYQFNNQNSRIIDFLINYDGNMYDQSILALSKIAIANPQNNITQQQTFALPYILDQSNNKRIQIFHNLLNENIKLNLIENATIKENEFLEKNQYYFSFSNDEKNNPFCELRYRIGKEIFCKKINVNVIYDLVFVKIQRGYEDFKEEILSCVKNIDPNISIRYGYTPLMMALEFNARDLAYMLINNSANLLQKDYNGNNLFYYDDKHNLLPNLILNKNLEGNVAQSLLELLLLDYKLYDKLKSQSYIDLIKHLIKSGANVNTTVTIDHRKHTLLEASIISPNVELVEYLLKEGAEINIKIDEMTLVEYCLSYASEELESELSQKQYKNIHNLLIQFQEEKNKNNDKINHNTYASLFAGNSNKNEKDREKKDDNEKDDNDFKKNNSPRN